MKRAGRPCWLRGPCTLCYLLLLSALTVAAYIGENLQHIYDHYILKNILIFPFLDHCCELSFCVILPKCPILMVKVSESLMSSCFIFIAFHWILDAACLRILVAYSLLPPLRWRTTGLELHW
ncbi:Protein of unknown function [Gryllus bimaculatus]|nr:Protein of unknown function [Gryllus bimaculatus]